MSAKIRMFSVSTSTTHPKNQSLARDCIAPRENRPDLGEL